MNILTSIKQKLPALKADFSRAETYVKTLVVASVSGAAADVVKLPFPRPTVTPSCSPRPVSWS